jgi:hypothetical protein
LVSAPLQTDRNEAEILLKNCVEHHTATIQLLELKVSTLSETLKSTQILAQQEKKDSSTHKAELATIHKAELAEAALMNKAREEEYTAISKSDKEKAEILFQNDVEHHILFQNDVEHHIATI